MPCASWPWCWCCWPSPRCCCSVSPLPHPSRLLQLVFHHAYTSAADALAPLVLAMILLSVSVVLTMYLLAVGQRWVAVVLVGGAVALTLAVLAVHGSPAGDRVGGPGGPGGGALS